MESKKANTYKEIIMKKLDGALMGLTITEISSKTGFHRNTVSKYVNILEAEGLVHKKEVSAARVYLSNKRKYVKRKELSKFMQALFRGLKDQFPNEEINLKEVGRKILEHFQFPISKDTVKEFDNLREIDTPQAQLKLFQEYYNAFDVLQEDLNISLMELQKNRAVYRLKNPEYLDSSNDDTYFFYFACGIVEQIYLQILNIKVKCNVKEIHSSSVKEESYVDFSLELSWVCLLNPLILYCIIVQKIKHFHCFLHI